MDLKTIQDHLGHFGLFQAFIYFLVCIVQIFDGIHMLANEFLLAVPNHRCYVPHCDNNQTQFDESFVHFSIPNITDDFGTTPDQCNRYELVKGAKFCDENAFNRNKTVPCQDFVWDRTEFEDTLVLDFDLVCDESWDATESSSIFMAGVLCGTAVFGLLADRFGRKTAMVVASIVLLISSTGTAFSNNFALFTFLRFVTASAVSGLAQTGFVIAVEFIGPSKRLIAGNVIQIIFACGELVLCLLAYFIRKWRILELVISVPGAIMITYYWLLPESVLWLISKKRLGEAKVIIRKAARWNNVDIPEDLLDSPTYGNDELLDETHQSVGPLSLVKTPIMRKWSLILFFIWIVNALVYYGLSLSAGDLGGSIYGNFAVLAAVEMPGIALATYALMRCGRRMVLFAVMVFGGVACVSTVFVPEHIQWLITLLAVLGKSAIAASFAIIYIYSAEIYPTVLRSTGIGFSSMFARLGSIIAPFVSQMRSLYIPLPMLIFGSASIIAGLLALLLPETHNRQLPETIEEAENAGRSSNDNDVSGRHLKGVNDLSFDSKRKSFDERQRLLDDS